MTVVYTAIFNNILYWGEIKKKKNPFSINVVCSKPRTAHFCNDDQILSYYWRIDEIVKFSGALANKHS